MADILFKEESCSIIGACFEVYKQKGCGFTEPIYQECLDIEFEMRGIPFVAQPVMELEYKGRQLTQFFKPDFLAFGGIIIGLKALSNIVDAHRAQVLNYLNATKFGLAHFPKLEYERIANNRNRTIFDEIQSRMPKAP